MPSKLIAVGVSHHSVPVQYREMVALSTEETKALLERLKNSFTDEALVISTCNRSEIYVRPINEEIDSEYLIDQLFELKQIPSADRSTLREQFARLSYCEAITHLFEVTAGIDSQILGDQQIFAQIKESFRLAEESGSSGTFMTKLAHAAFRVAKRVRTETHLTEGASTISYAAVEFARKVYDDLRNRTALIIGAGETAELTISYLLEKKVGQLFIANRSKENADTLVAKLRLSNPNLSRVRTFSLSEIPTILPSSDIVISSTGSQEPILRRKEIEPILAKRTESVPIVMVDIAVPRDIDPE
ncbi:MAG TPA: glutamyl-tRNA reductase, partial [Candidatus Kapabacteria bacterium]|nr:glutamyl-tRNA reductase [Candidatus Kapabacteria bacterium]